MRPKAELLLLGRLTCLYILDQHKLIVMLRLKTFRIMRLILITDISLYMNWQNVQFLVTIQREGIGEIMAVTDFYQDKWHRPLLTLFMFSVKMTMFILLQKSLSRKYSTMKKKPIAQTHGLQRIHRIRSGVKGPNRTNSIVKNLQKRQFLKALLVNFLNSLY